MTTDTYANFSNPKKMYHKIRSCHDLMLGSGQEFDAVLRLRPDKAALHQQPGFDWHEMIRYSASERVLFTDVRLNISPVSGLIVGDQVGLGTPDMMDFYARAVEMAAKGARLDWFDWPRTERAHANLAHSIWLVQIKVALLPIAWGDLKDPEPLSQSQVLSLLEQDVADRTPDSHDRSLLEAGRAFISL